MMLYTTGTPEQINTQIRGFLQEAESIRQKLQELKHPKTTLVDEITGSAVEGLIPNVLGETAGEIAKSFGFPGTLVRKYTKTGTRNYLKQSQKQQSDATQRQISIAIDNLIDRIIGLLSQISSVKPSLRDGGNSNELCRKFARARSLQKPGPKISHVVSSLNEVLTVHLIYNADIPKFLAEHHSSQLSAYELLKQLESSLRISIEKAMSEISPDWWNARIPNDVKQNAENRKRRNEKQWPWTTVDNLHVIHYIDFPDYAKIITRRDNWNEVFEKIFGNRERLIQKLNELEPIRNAIAHSRDISQRDLLKLQLYTEEIATALLQITK